MEGFVNYWHQPCRANSLNLTVARVFICLWAAWKVFAFPFAGITDYPTDLLEADDTRMWSTWPEYGHWIEREQYIAVICLLLCAFGIATRLTSVAAAVIISHLTAVVWPVNLEKTWLPTVYFLLLYGVFQHEDRLVIWPTRKDTGAAAPRHAGSSLCVPGTGLHSLKWFLVTIALIYFFAGMHKLRGGGWSIEWVSPVNMSRMLEKRAFIRGNPLPPLATWIQQSPILLGIVGFASVALELGLIVSVMTNRFLTPCLIGLACMHLGIWGAMSLNYFTDMLAMYLVFVPWDSMSEAIRGFLVRAAQRSKRIFSKTLQYFRL